MGAFVLGVLVGWLAEWLFFTFIVKADEGQGADCSHLKAELETKNRQINSLQDQLASSTTKSVASSTSSAGNITTVKTGSVNQSPSANKAQTSMAKESSATTATKKTTATTAKKSTVTSTTTKAKTSAKGSSAKGSATKGSAAKAKTTAKVSGSKRASSKGDDFTKLSGIGPSMSETLKSLGIDTFEKLASTDDDILRDMLEESGARMNNNKEVMDSWNEQATVAAKGDFAALKKMQAVLKK